MVLAELAGGVAVGFQKRGDCGVLRAHSGRCTRKAHLAQSCAEHALTHDEGSTPRGAALLTVAIGKQHSFVSYTVDVGRLVAHHPAAVAAQVPVPDVISPDNQDIGFSVRHPSSPHER